MRIVIRSFVLLNAPQSKHEFFEITNNFYFCGKLCDTDVKDNNTKITLNGSDKGLVQNDELYQTNSVAYIESDLKINHLRILMAIIKHLQKPIRYKVDRACRSSRIPEALLPELNNHTRFGRTRTIEIPVSDFNIGRNNGARLRACLDELCSTRIVFPTVSAYLLNVFPGLIAGYSFPAYSKKVRIYLHEQLVGRLLLTEEGFSHYSHSKALTLTNKYTVRLYWLICSWRNRGGFVISLNSLRRILQLGIGYDKFSAIVTRVLAPAQSQLQKSFPIWFQYRVYDMDGKRRLAFKIKVILTENEQKRLRKEAYDFCFNLLSKSGISVDVLGDMFLLVETEDLKPFVLKVMDVTAYIAAHPNIRDRGGYLRASLDSWLDNWILRYQDVGE